MDVESVKQTKVIWTTAKQTASSRIISCIVKLDDSLCNIITTVPVFFVYFKTGNHYNPLKTHCFSPTGMIERQEDAGAANRAPHLHPACSSLSPSPSPSLILRAPRAGGGWNLPLSRPTKFGIFHPDLRFDRIGSFDVIFFFLFLNTNGTNKLIVKEQTFSDYSTDRWLCSGLRRRQRGSRDNWEPGEF